MPETNFNDLFVPTYGIFGITTRTTVLMIVVMLVSCASATIAYAKAASQYFPIRGAAHMKRRHKLGKNPRQFGWWLVLAIALHLPAFPAALVLVLTHLTDFSSATGLFEILVSVLAEATMLAIPPCAGYWQYIQR